MLPEAAHLRRERVRQESLAIAKSGQEREIMDWVEQVTDYSGWEP